MPNLIVIRVFVYTMRILCNGIYCEFFCQIAEKGMQSSVTNVSVGTGEQLCWEHVRFQVQCWSQVLDQYCVFGPIMLPKVTPPSFSTYITMLMRNDIVSFEKNIVNWINLFVITRKTLSLFNTVYLNTVKISMNEFLFDKWN